MRNCDVKLTECRVNPVTLMTFCFLIWMLITNALYASNEFNFQSCDGDRHIFLVDRTSKLNDRELDAFRDGMSVIFERSDFSGLIEIAEVRGSALSYEWVYRTCVEPAFRPPPPCINYFESMSVGRIGSTNVGFFENPSAWFASLFKPVAEQYSNNLIIVCEREKSAFYAKRETQRNEAFGAILEESLANIQESRTALAETIFGIVRSRCTLEECRLYIFSNLLDEGWQNVIFEGSDLRARGRIKVEADPMLDQSQSNVSSVVVWGFGFDERNGETKQALSPEYISRLNEYWRGLLSEITDGSIEINFELPR